MRRAFTLIELLVVIAIIAVLAAILFPVFARAKAAAKTTETISNLRNLGAAMALYQGDSDDVLPPSTEGFGGAGREGGWTFYDTFGDAEAGRFQPEKGVLFPYVKGAGVYVSKNDGDAARSRNSFAFNGCLLVPPFQSGINASVSPTVLPDPAGRMLLGEEGVSDRDNGTNDGFLHPFFDHFAERHAGGTAILFVDGHAKVVHANDRFMEIVDGGPTPCW